MNSQGEVVFTTGMTGYQETLSDPSFYGQIVTLTYPLIGNYGINRDDFESITPAIRGFVVRELADQPSNWRSDMTLDAYLKSQNIIKRFFKIMFKCFYSIFVCFITIEIDIVARSYIVVCTSTKRIFFCRTIRESKRATQKTDNVKITFQSIVFRYNSKNNVLFYLFVLIFEPFGCYLNSIFHIN